MKEVFSFWYSKPGFKGITKLEILCIKSWLDKGYDFVLYTYNKDDIIFNKLNELFENFKLKDANEIIPFNELFYDVRGAGLAAFSDYFRFKKIQMGGGVWVDMDMLCLNGFEKKEYMISTELLENKEIKITTGFLSFPQNSSFGASLLLKAEEIINKRKLVPWGCIGPEFLAKHCNEFFDEKELKKISLDYKKSSQISYFEVQKFVLKNSVIDENEFVLHFYTEAWRQKGLKKDASYNKNCPYEKFQNRHELKALLEKLDYKISFFDRYLSKYIYYLFYGPLNLWKRSKIRALIRNPKRFLSLNKRRKNECL